MKQTNVRIGALNDFAVKLKHQSQHPVRGRMLRSEVQCVVLDLSHRVSLALGHNPLRESRAAHSRAARS